MKSFKIPAIFGAFDGEEDKSKQILEKLGFTGEMIEKVNKGELSIDDAVKERMSKIENNVKERIESEVEKAKKSEIFAAAHSKNEKLIAKAFGLDYSKYESMDKDGRAEKMLQDAAELQSSKVKELEEKYSGADAEKVKKLEEKYQKMLDTVNTELQSEKTAREQALAEADAKVKGIKRNIAITERKAKFLAGLQNTALTPKQIETIVNAELEKYGVDIEEGENSRAWVLDSEGKRIVNPKKPSENLTVDDLLLNIKDDFEFEKKSNGSDDKAIELPGNGTGLEHQSDAYKKQMELAKSALTKK